VKVKSAGALHPPKGKSPMTIRISSLKTNPTIVNNSLTDDESNSVKSKVTKKVITKPPSESLPQQEQSSSSNPGDESSEETKFPPKAPVPATTSVTSAETSKGILASALGGPPRVTRRTSISSGGSESAPPGDKQRLLRSANVKASPTVEEDSTESADKAEETPLPPESFLQSIGLRKASDMSSSGKPEATSSGAGESSIKVKNEPEDPIDDEDEGEGETEETVEPAPPSVGIKRPISSAGPGVMKPHEILNLPGAKSGAVRYSLSKDISISAVDEHTGKEIIRIKKPIPGARVPPGLIPQQPGQRPRVMNSNGGAHIVGNQRVMNPNQRLTRPVRGPGGAVIRPNNIRMK